MKNTISKQAETLKKQVDNASQKSKESIKHLVDVNSKQFDSAVKANSKTFDAISKALYEKEMDPAIVRAFKSNFIKSLKLSEETIDSIIDAHKKRIDVSVDFTEKFAEAIKNEDMTSKEGVEKLLNILKENLHRSTELSLRNMEKVATIYNDHLNLVLNFNRKFADNINAQVSTLFKLQNKNVDSSALLDMVNQWWKTTAAEEKTATV